jgi:hypothetical protein
MSVYQRMPGVEELCGIFILSPQVKMPFCITHETPALQSNIFLLY